MKLLLIFFFGAMWGSFFFTLSIRYINGVFSKDGMRALFSTSACPECRWKINPIHLIPIVGYLIIRGRCNNCGMKISPMYPVFEVIYGFLLIIIVSKNGENIHAFTLFLIIGLAIAISSIDVKTLIIPNTLLIVFIFLSIYPIILHNSLKDNLYGFFFMGVFFIIILLIFPGSFGGGDIKFASAIGALLGLELSIVVLEVALISGSITGIIYAIKTKKGLRIKMPFAPFLTLGIFISLLYGRDIALLYYSLLCLI